MRRFVFFVFLIRRFVFFLFFINKPLLKCILTVYIHVDADFSLFVSVLLLTVFKNIDVDQIVEEHQSTCTPKPSISKFPPITPTADKDNFARQGDNVLPPELCLDCIHGYKVFLFRHFDLSQVIHVYLSD